MPKWLKETIIFLLLLAVFTFILHKDDCVETDTYKCKPTSVNEDY